ncbi:EAL domain-containing protein [Parasalinivibrio latis]|uniref:bifunctional diguanylate cyclase/phosphodiesterase n=1 Tax=Parasalinivibrio latis TaxID=2952610 RepID=UPI0030DEE745
MTLINKINLVVVSILLLMCGLLGYVQFDNNLRFLEKELESLANTSIRHLDVALVPILESGDTEKSDTLLTTIMEDGSLSAAKLVWLLDGKQQSWQIENIETQAPEWFVSLGLIAPVSVSTTVSSGWIELANLSITISPAKAYETLWRLSLPFLALTTATILIVSVFVRIFTRKILSPIYAISEESKRIARLEFSTQLPLPKSGDLRELTNAFNSMSRQLSQLFDTLNEEVRKLREKTLYDSVSGLPNRTFFTRRMNSWMDDETGGVIMFLRLNWLELLNQRYGFQVRDDSWKLLAKGITGILSSSPDATVARLSHNEVAILIPGADDAETRRILQVLIRLLNNEVTQSGLPVSDSFAIGLVNRTDEKTPSELLSKADNAVQEAEEKGETFLFADSGKHLSKEQWRATLTEIIESGNLRLQWQPVISTSDGSILHKEIFAQVLLDDDFVPAAQILNNLERFSLGSSFDQLVVTMTVKAIVNLAPSSPISINLTADSIKDTTFTTWLLQTIKRHRIESSVYLELNEMVAYRSPETAHRFCSLMKKNNIRYGIDQFGRQLGSVAYLKRLRPDFVKLDQSFSFDEGDESNALMLLPMINMATSLGIEVIATGIQHSEQLSNFKEMKLGGYQGYIMPPELISDGADEEDKKAS